MDRLNHVLNIKQEKDDGEQKKVSTINTEKKQQNNKGTLSRQGNITLPSNIYTKQELEDDEHAKVKNITQQQQNSVQRCTIVKKEEDCGECKVEWDGDECDCAEYRVERQIKIEFNQTNTTKQINSCLRPSEKGASEQCKKEEKEDANENYLAPNDIKSLDDEDREDGYELNRVEQSGQISNDDDDDDETEIDDEEYEMEVDDDHHEQHNSDASMAIPQEDRNENNAIATGCNTNPIQPNLLPPNRHLQCSNCPKSFERKHDFTRHVRVHTGERPFQCDLCDKRFSVKSNLTKHQLIHQNRKRFQCAQCDKQFTQKHSLDSHLRMHSGERPFACRHCEKSFTGLGDRTKHEQAIHLHVKPYRCKQCAHTATHRSDVIRHIRTVHFGLPRTIKEQRALNIIDERDTRELVEKV